MRNKERDVCTAQSLQRNGGGRGGGRGEEGVTINNEESERQKKGPQRSPLLSMSQAVVSPVYYCELYLHHQ